MISFYQYQLPFVTPFKTGAGDIVSREGILIHFKDEDVDILAEASPLPGFSSESFKSVKKHLMSLKSELDAFLKGSFSIDDLQQFISGPSSIQFALSDLGWKIIQFRGGQPAGHPLFQSKKKPVLVNDIVGSHDPATTKRLILSALHDGFKTIKIKTVSPDPKLAAVLHEIYAQNKDVIFRLDANQSWNVEKLKIFNREFKNLPIEYIEEPYELHRDEEIDRAFTMSAYPIAIDESIRDSNHLGKLLEKYPNLFIIIKPMMLGNIFSISETLLKYRSSYKRVVITSSLESAVGLGTISKLAASIGDNSLAHGLNTKKLFRKDIVTGNDINNGVLILPGRTISLNQLDQSMLTQI
tara:strand:- start:15507 stop:16568 length:1062 start_codon:yes stop_codon:yes gene_type:complete